MIKQPTVMIGLSSLLQENYFQERHKDFGSFTRNRKLSFEPVAGMILRMVKTSTQIACNWLGDFMNTDPVSKQAFSQARQKMRHTAFQEMHAHGLHPIYTMAPKDGLWKEYRVIAADGSTLRLPESEELAREFGRWETRADLAPSPPMARISEYTDMKQN